MIVDCDLRKWDGRQGYTFQAELLGRDDYGTWLGVPPGSSFVGPKSPGVWNDPFVICVPDGEWWIASFYGEGNVLGMQVYVDMATVAEWPSESAVRCIDLDLDVVRYLDDRIELLDEDEFAAHLVEMSYPDDIVDRARATAQSMLEALRARTEPFDTVGAQWLARRTL